MRKATHSHWPKGWPQHDAIRCSLSKAECDARWTAYLHHHEGRPCEKRVEPGNKIATCILRPGASKRGSK